jgi:hypothetical protein
MIQVGSLVRFLKDTDKVDPAYWNLVGVVVDLQVDTTWLWGREDRCDVLVESHIIKCCYEGYEIEEVTDEAG